MTNTTSNSSSAWDTAPADVPEEAPGALFVDPTRWSDMDRWHAEARELRATSPVLKVCVPGTPDFWAITRHEDVSAIERDDAHWPNTARSTLMPDDAWNHLLDSGVPLPATLVHLDGPKHRKHRQVTSDWFKPAAVGTRQPRIDDLADVFVDKMRNLGGECDFAADVAVPYTLRVIMDIYGVPEADEALILELTQGTFGAADPEYLGDAANPQERVTASLLSFIAYFNQVTEDRRACPRDDLASVIANGEVDGHPIGDLERFWYYVIVATAGHDTTSYALSGGMEALLRDRDQLWALAQHPDRVVNATDEIIRWTSPVRHFLRYATRDTDIRGQTIRAGDAVLLSYPSANRDEDVFINPDHFDITRPDAGKSLSFGAGTHFCLGAQLARREIRTMISKLVDQLEWIEPAGSPGWSQSSFVSGVKHLPIRYAFK